MEGLSAAAMGTRACPRTTTALKAEQPDYIVANDIHICYNKNKMETTETRKPVKIRTPEQKLARLLRDQSKRKAVTADASISNETVAGIEQALNDAGVVRARTLTVSEINTEIEQRIKEFKSVEPQSLAVQAAEAEKLLKRVQQTIENLPSRKSDQALSSSNGPVLATAVLESPSEIEVAVGNRPSIIQPSVAHQHAGVAVPKIRGIIENRVGDVFVLNSAVLLGEGPALPLSRHALIRLRQAIDGVLEKISA